MDTKTFIISLVLVVIVLFGAVAFYTGMISFDKEPEKTSAYCEKDTDCNPYCGIDRNDSGRGVCVHNSYILGAILDLKQDSICKKDLLHECNRCKCASNECQTVPTGLMEC
jgi:hypothetical protein